MDGEIFGFMSTLCLALCGIPQAYKCFKTGNAKGLSVLFLFSWLVGEILLIPYAIYLDCAIPILINASINLIIVSIIFRYYYFPRE
jgi:uncharacterized protein with PQ loop repeat